jgi:hypothetical protein
MKNRKVLNLRTHIGGFHGKTSYDSQRNECDMELLANGVLIKSMKGKECNLFVPFANVVEAHLAPEEYFESEEPKRGPGRPPGPRAA